MAGWSPTAGPNPRSTMQRVQLIISRNTSPVVGHWISWVAVTINPIISYGLGGSASSAGIPVVPLQGLHNFHKPWQRGRGWHLDSTSHGATSQVRVVCEVIWAVVVVCHTGHISQWAAKRDPLGQAWWLLLWLQSHWAGSASQGEAGSGGQGEVISTQLEARASLRTSSSVKETSGSITQQSSTMLSVTWQGSLGTGGWAFSTQYWRALAYVRVSGPNCWIAGLGEAWTGISLGIRGTGGVEWSLFTLIMQLPTIGSSNDAHTFHVNSWWSSWSGTSCSSHHQSGVSTCQGHHDIHSALSMGEGSGSLATIVCERLSSIPCLPGTSPPHTGASGGGAPVVGTL